MHFRPHIAFDLSSAEPRLNQRSHWRHGRSPSAEGWGKIDFTWSIRNWIMYQNLYHVIDISCNTCEKHPKLDLFSLDYGYRPFIVVNTTSSQTIKRQRRSINCSPGISECCRDKLYISFAEIGWSDWILHPAGYDAYFCRGSCASAATISSNSSTYHLFVRVSVAIFLRRCCALNVVFRVHFVFFHRCPVDPSLSLLSASAIVL